MVDSIRTDSLRTQDDGTGMETYEMETLLRSSQRGVCRTWVQRVRDVFLKSWQKMRRLGVSGDLGHQEVRLRQTAYLDGLRGFAAFLVFVTHHEGWAHSQDWNEFHILESPWGSQGMFYFIRFPLIRTFFTGSHLGVTMFFIISGYVLSMSGLSSIIEDKTERLVTVLSSAIFRRWIRLFFPVFVSTFLFMTTWHILDIKSAQSFDFSPEPTYVADIVRWLKEMARFSYVFDAVPMNGYNDHTWTIPVEFRGSIIIFTVSLAVARFSTAKRLLCEAVMIFYFLFIVDGWSNSCFCIGMLACDLQTLSASNKLPQALKRHIPEKTWFYLMLLGIGIYVGGVPEFVKDIEDLRRALGWHYLASLAPPACADFRMFYRTWGAAFVFISTSHLPWLKKFFETFSCQFLGQISFSLYLVHGPILWTIGDRFYAAAGRSNSADTETIRQSWGNTFSISSWGPYGLEINFIIPFLVTLVISTSIAWVMTRFIDEPIIRLGKKLYQLDWDTRPSR